jgi:hypothetical protein
VVNMLLAGWCSWISGILLKVECFELSAMVERIWVDGWWRGGWFWVEVSGKPSSEWRRWLTHLDGIIRVVFELRTRWTPNVGSQSLKAFTLDTRKGKV